MCKYLIFINSLKKCENISRQAYFHTCNYVICSSIYLKKIKNSI